MSERGPRRASAPPVATPATWCATTTSPTGARGGPDLGERLDRAGWNARAWGETIAYGCGSSGTPKATLRSWLNSPPHRAIVLSGEFGRGGLGVGSEALCGARGATWVMNLGRK